MPGGGDSDSRLTATAEEARREKHFRDSYGEALGPELRHAVRIDGAVSSALLCLSRYGFEGLGSSGPRAQRFRARFAQYSTDGNQEPRGS